jgi:hypothetical protein
MIQQHFRPAAFLHTHQLKDLAMLRSKAAFPQASSWAPVAATAKALVAISEAGMGRAGARLVHGLSASRSSRADEEAGTAPPTGPRRGDGDKGNGTQLWGEEGYVEVRQEEQKSLFIVL